MIETATQVLIKIESDSHGSPRLLVKASDIDMPWTWLRDTEAVTDNAKISAEGLLTISRFTSEKPAFVPTLIELGMSPSLNVEDRPEGLLVSDDIDALSRITEGTAERVLCLRDTDYGYRIATLYVADGLLVFDRLQRRDPVASIDIVYRDPLTGLEYFRCVPNAKLTVLVAEMRKAARALLDAVQDHGIEGPSFYNPDSTAVEQAAHVFDSARDNWEGYLSSDALPEHENLWDPGVWYGGYFTGLHTDDKFHELFANGEKL